MQKLFNGRIISLFLIVAMIISVLPVITLAEETKEYAEIILGVEIKQKNAEIRGSSINLPTDTKKGKTGRRTSQANNLHYVIVLINDGFMYDLPDDTPVDITVEYFDDSAGYFNLTYDSHNPLYNWNNIENNQVTAETESVYMTNTQEWKKHTFHLEDLRAANRQDGFYDFRISCWNPRVGFSTKDVLFGSIKIEYGKHDIPVRIGELDMGQLGHLMSAEDKKVMSIPMTNRLDEKVEIDWEFTIYDEFERPIGTVNHKNELSAKESKTEEIDIGEITKHGLYTVKGKAKMKAESNPNEAFEKDLETKFSVSFVYDVDSLDKTYGTNFQTVNGGFNNPESSAEAMIRGGMSYNRDVIRGGFDKLGPGKYVLNSAGQRWLKQIDMGIEFIAIVMREPGITDTIPPETDEEIAEWASFIKCAAKEFGDKVKYYEIWNEYNFKGFNSTMAPPENYAKMIKAAYEAIKSVNPNAVVIGMDICPPEGTDIMVDLDWAKRALDAGAYEYMDAVSLHPYDHVGGVYREQKYIKELTDFRELLSQYGEVKPIWSTEVGFMTIGPENYYTQTEQSRGMVLTRAIGRAYELIDYDVVYCLADRERRDYNPDNWGFLNSFRWPEPVPYSAKPGWVALTAFSYFVNQNTTIKDKIEKDRFYALNFYNPDLKKNVLYLQAGVTAGEVFKSYKLGCTSLELYDIYGNKTATLTSDNGEYSFLVDNEPVYVVGNFTEFREVAKESLIGVDAVQKTSASGDVVEFNFTKNTGKKLEIFVDGAEVVENNGFVGNSANLKVRVPKPTSKMHMISIEDFIPFDITIKDEDGKVYYRKQHRLGVMEAIEISSEVEEASKLNGNRNRLKITVKNLSNNSPATGELSLISPEKVGMSRTVRPFYKLPAGQSVTFLFNLPETVIKEVIDVEALVTLDNGYTREHTDMHTVCNSVYAEKKPTIDGVVGDSEWTGSSWVGASKEKNLQLAYTWSGIDDLSFSITSKWDEDNFYFLGIVRDDMHITNGEGPGKLWQADSFQIGIVDGIRRDGFATSVYTEFTLGHVPSHGDLIYRHKSMLNNLPLDIVQNCEIVVKRYDDYTVYEASIPWSEIFEEGYEMKEGDGWRFSALANDQDGQGRYYMEYTGGIGTVKNADDFGTMKMVKK